MPFAQAEDGARLYYEISGEGEPLLLIPGRNNDHHIWNLMRGDFEKHHLVIVYDPRGTGQSDKPEQPPYSTRGFARDAVAVLDQLGLSRAHVYGISMGGAVGQWLGIDHGDRVGALVLACSSPGFAHGVRAEEKVRALIEQKDSTRILSTFFVHRWGAPRFFLSMRESLKFPMPEYAEQLYARASEEHDSWDGLPAIKAPTLILQGSDDPICPAANASLLAERIPGAELTVIKGGRHMFFVEYRGKVDRLVTQFLARHPLGPPAS